MVDFAALSETHADSADPVVLRARFYQSYRAELQRADIGDVRPVFEHATAQADAGSGGQPTWPISNGSRIHEVLPSPPSRARTLTAGLVSLVVIR
jgi:hypothetical protein